MNARVALGLAIGLAVALGAPTGQKHVGRASATEVEGRVTVRGTLQTPPEARGRYHWQAENGVLAVRPPRVELDRDVALAFSGPAPAGNPETVTIRMLDGGLSPAAFVVRPGTLVRFQNDDLFTHELYVPSRDDPAGQPWFRAEPTGRGSNRDVRFSQAGVYELRCKRAPHLRGWIAVEDVAKAVTPDARGGFETDLPAGRWRVRVFHGGRWLAEQSIEVEEGRAPEVALEATLPAAPAAAAPAKRRAR